MHPDMHIQLYQVALPNIGKFWLLTSLRRGQPKTKALLRPPKISDSTPSLSLCCSDTNGRTSGDWGGLRGKQERGRKEETKISATFHQMKLHFPFFLFSEWMKRHSNHISHLSAQLFCFCCFQPEHIVIFYNIHTLPTAMGVLGLFQFLV